MTDKRGGPTGADGGVQGRLAALTPEARAELREALRRRSGSATVPRRPDDGPAPLSSSQQRMWFLDQWEPGSPANNGARAVRLRGNLDVAALERALRTVVERHATLRTVYVLERREPHQIQLASWSLELPVVDLASVEPEGRELELERLMRAESRCGFDLSRDLMIRPTLFRLGPADHVLLLAIHHIAFDASSDRVLNHELAELYDAYVVGRPPELPALPIEYADYAVWQRQRLQGAFLDELVHYWRGALEGAPERLRLPTDRPRSSVQRHRGVHRRFSFDGSLGDAVGELARGHGVTTFMTLLAAFDTLLYGFTGQEDILVGSPVAGRNHVELDGLIGFFSNTLVLRNRLVGNPTFRELLLRVRASTVGALAHQDLPFEKLVESLGVRRDPSFNPFFQVNFRAQAEQRELLHLPGLQTVGVIPIDIGFSRFDLALELQLRGADLAGYFEYDEELFDASTIELMTADFEELVHRIVTAPDTPVLALLPRRARHVSSRPLIPRTAH